MIGIVMGSASDYPTMRAAAEVLQSFDIPHEVRVISAHRTPEKMVDYATSARSRGLRAIIAGAGGAAHLPGMLAALTPLPVLGVPVRSTALSGVDSLLSIAQMPGGVPTATFAIGEPGAINAALFLVRFLALRDERLASRLDEDRARRARESNLSDQELQARATSDARGAE
jgi:5-(carboxyamino)imidazole ribonucleotide mutase